MNESTRSTRLQQLFERYPVLEAGEKSLIGALQMVIAAYERKGALLVCGNGGSAADAEHLVGELMKDFRKRRRLPAGDAEKLRHASPEAGDKIAAQLQGGLRALSLVSQTSLLTAIANDISSEMIFAQQVYAYGKPGDVLLAISTSGNSANVMHAVTTARAFGIKSIALTGQVGGALAGVVDIAIRVPAEEVAEVQELHLPVYHWLATELEETFFPG